MIVYLVTDENSFTVAHYLQEWKPELADRILIVTYESLPARTSLPAATYIFSDIERLGPAATRMAICLWEALSQAGMRLINHPVDSLRRQALLAMLQETGQNLFRARRLHEVPNDLRFPVFLRIGNDHSGPATRLLNDQTELWQATWVQRLRRADTAEMLVIEFCDTVDAQGLYRKYSAYVVGDRIVPRHVLFSRHWVQKYPDLLSDAQAGEQMAYLRDNPHREALTGIFRNAGIAYGRIDYSLRDGRIQVWEINTNPTLIHHRADYPPQALPVQEEFTRCFAEALLDLDSPAGANIPFHFDAELVRAVRQEWLDRASRKRRFQRMRRLLMKIPLFWWGKYDYRTPGT